MKKILGGANLDSAANPDSEKFEKYTVDLFFLSLFNIVQYIFFKNVNPSSISGTHVNLGGANMDSHFQIPFSLRYY